MNILIIGSGGREHALADAYAKNKRVEIVFVAPGNDFMAETNKKVQTLSYISVSDFDAIKKIVKTKHIGLVDVAQDEPLAKGLVDILRNEGVHVFGPTQNAAEIEWDKEWARHFMQLYKLPIPKFQAFSDTKKAIAYINSIPEQTLFIKASGLALGKGVIKATTRKEAITAIASMKNFGKAGETFLIEHALVGSEFSLFALCDGSDYKVVGVAQDHKTVFVKDKGPNTGGMGCVSPIKHITKNEIKIIERTILKPFLKGMKKEGRSYSGVLYLGGMLTKKGIFIIEFNARWGDPEAEVILPSLKTDYLTLVEKITKKQFNNTTISHDNKIRISVAGCAHGYPSDYKSATGKKIFGLEEVMKMPNIKIFGAGIKKKGTSFVVNGGRVFHLIAEGKSIEEARKNAYAAMSQIYIEDNNLQYRTDIGWREIEE